MVEQPIDSVILTGESHQDAESAIVDSPPEQRTPTETISKTEGPESLETVRPVIWPQRREELDPSRGDPEVERSRDCTECRKYNKPGIEGKELENEIGCRKQITKKKQIRKKQKTEMDERIAQSQTWNCSSSETPNVQASLTQLNLQSRPMT
jgi:hypothetical protein